ncbi:hypothetical protein C8Q76DRAFT_692119 [Earliella scabrosa]|nr:hypothetical protein C8Q76DRAFT_692119 [Earliella scabrosa]
MSALAAHYVSDRRYSDIHYDPAAYFSYSQPSLGAVTASASSLEGSYALGAPSTSSYVWDTHESVLSSSYSTSSSAPANAYSSSSTSAHPGPSALPTYPSDYASHRIPSSRSNAFSASSAASSTAASGLSSPSSRSSYASAPRAYSSLADAAISPASSSAVPSRLQNAQWDNSALYTIDTADTMSPPPSSPIAPSPSPPIKEEDPEMGFVIEVSVPDKQPLASNMSEVPLRATHAPPRMRKMMCSFRLENFAMHDGIRSAATQPGAGGIEVGPLREKPVELEWQVELDTPLVPQEPDALRHGFVPQAPSRSARTSDLYRTVSPASGPSRQSTRSTYDTPSSPSPPLSVDYSPAAVDSDSWDASSGYGSVADSGSGSTPVMTASPTFAAVMTPAQSLGWNLRPGYGEMGLSESSTYRRPVSVQSSLSRVSQTNGQYLIGGGSKSAYQQHPSQYAYDSTSFSRGSSSSGRYSEVYASSGSAWSYGRSQ